MIRQRRPRLLPLRLLVLALSLCVAHLAFADDEEAATACPVGVLKCPKKSKKQMYALCKRNDMLDFFVPGLPTTGDRSTVPSDLSARKVTATVS